MATCADKPLTVDEALALAVPARQLCQVALDTLPETSARERAVFRGHATTLDEVVDTLVGALNAGKSSPDALAGTRGVEACRTATRVYEAARALQPGQFPAIESARHTLGIRLGLEKDNVVAFPGAVVAIEQPAASAPQQAPTKPRGVPGGVVLGILLGAITFGVGIGAAIVSTRRSPQVGD